MINNTIMKRFKNKQLLIGILVGLVVAGLAALSAYALTNAKSKASWSPVADIEKKSSEFINTKLLQGSGSATAKVVGKEGDLYRLEVLYNGQKIESFMSKDGKRFFPQSYSLSESSTKDAGVKSSKPSTEPVADNVEKKSDKPAVELFVMSHCPYGTQIEKGIVPVVEALGNKIDFKLKFTDYAMHGEKELKEQLSQYCIQKEQPTKLLAYLKAFLKDGDSTASISQSGVDKAKLSACVDKTDKEFSVLKDFNAKSGFKGNFPGFGIFKADNTKYGVSGSPTLIINGVKSQSARDSKSLLKSICSAFNNQPEECKAQLSGDAPAPGFGTGVAASGNANAGGCQ
jgi:hypothetical protein